VKVGHKGTHVENKVDAFQGIVAEKGSSKSEQKLKETYGEEETGEDENQKKTKAKKVCQRPCTLWLGNIF